MAWRVGSTLNYCCVFIRIVLSFTCTVLMKLRLEGIPNAQSTCYRHEFTQKQRFESLKTQSMASHESEIHSQKGWLERELEDKSAAVLTTFWFCKRAETSDWQPPHWIHTRSVAYYLFDFCATDEYDLPIRTDTRTYTRVHSHAHSTHHVNSRMHPQLHIHTYCRQTKSIKIWTH